MTAALGTTSDEGHFNYGMLDTESKYEQIRDKAIELIKKRHEKTK